MGAQQSKKQSIAPQQPGLNNPRTMGQRPSTPVNQPRCNATPVVAPTTTPEEEPVETEYKPPRELSSLNVTETTSEKPVPSKLNRFRVKVPPSMAPGDIMTIKLGGILTKVLIATPTTSTTNKAPSEAIKSGLHAPSRAATSCDSTSSSSCPSPSRVETAAETKAIDSVFASTDAHVPEGKIIAEAKPVVVVHAVFTQDDKELKDQMADEAIREIIQATVDSGCNALLGMTISIKKQSGEGATGYLVKACGTPCILMPAQVLLAPPASSSLPVPVRKRTSSTEILPARRQ